MNLLEALATAHPSVKRFVLVSSLTAYGPSNLGPPKRECDAREPVEHYGRSKLEAEQAVEGYGERLPWTIIRPPAVYGPAEVDMFTLFRAAKSGINLFFGNRDKRTSAVYVDDLVHAMVAARCPSARAGAATSSRTACSYSWGEVQKHIVAAVGKRTLHLNLPASWCLRRGLAGSC